jgi:ribosome biogenesis protein BMS1
MLISLVYASYLSYSSIREGKKKRFTFIECPQDIYSMTDLSKVADLVLLLIDASYGFEMETFEFLNQLQIHGFPKVMGVMTHLDGFINKNKMLQVRFSLFI